MPVHVLTGPDSAALDAHLRRILGDRRPTTQDISGDGGDELVTLAAARTLFGGAQLIHASPASDLTPSNAAALVATSADNVVVLTDSRDLPVALTRALSGASLTRCALPGPREAPARVRALLTDTGVRVSADAERLLTQRAAADWPRVHRLLTTLATIGITDLDDALAAALLGTGPERGMPWDVAAAAERGDTAGAIAAARACEPVASVAFLARRLQRAGLVVDAGVRDPRAVAELTGTAAGMAGALLRLADRLGPAGVRTSWALLAEADTTAKTAPHAAAAMDVLATRLTKLWGPAT